MLDVVKCGSSAPPLARASLVICGAFPRGDGLASEDDEPTSEACRSSDRSTLRVLLRGLRFLPGLSSSELSVSSASISWRCTRVVLDACTGLLAPLVGRNGGK